MHKTKVFAVAFCLVFPAFSAFSGEVRDPSGVLTQLDKLQSNMSFEQAFQCGDAAKIRMFHVNCRFSCGADGCGSICEQTSDEFMRKVADCSPESVSLIDEDGTAQEVTAADYQRASGNLLRQELASLDAFLGVAGVVELAEMHPVEFALPSGAKIPALEVTGRYSVGGQGFDLLYNVAKEGPGLAQVLYKRIGGVKIFKVREIKR